jgi:uncharacterized protein (DUF1501 family)
MTGAIGYFNTAVPYASLLHYDNRPTVHVAEDQVLHLHDQVGFHPSIRAIKGLYDEGMEPDRMSDLIFGLRGVA